MLRGERDSRPADAGTANAEVIMKFETLQFERRDRIAFVTLNRPDKLNALNLQLIEDLRAAAAAVAADPQIGAVLLTGAGRGFSAAPPHPRRFLSGREAEPRPEHRRELAQPLQPDGERLVRPRSPLVVAVNGVAAGRE